MLKHKHLVILLMLMLVLTAIFWIQSRYPALNEKAAMQGNLSISGLAFNPVIAISPDDSKLRSIMYSTINWAETNRQGMTFGILLAALVMTILPLVRLWRLKNRMGNALMGSLLGAPLGVCVNCATPIAKGMLAGGGRLETALATMSSSPTMNVVVLTMLFTMLPFYLAITKVIASLVFILVVIPLLTRFLGPTDAICAIPASSGKPSAATLTPEVSASHGWREAGRWVWHQSLRNLCYVLKTMLPLMLLAGLLGAIAVTLVPFEMLASTAPEQSGLAGFGWMLAIALFGIFLPIPIAFDIIITMALLQAGLPVQYGMVLLFTLGIFSIYPFMMIWRDVSRQLAIGMVVAVLVMATATGMLATRLQQQNIAAGKQAIADAFLDKSSPPWVARFFGRQQPEDETMLVSALQQHSLIPAPVAISDLAGPFDIQVFAMPFLQRSPDAATLFSKIDAATLGISPPYAYSALKSMDVFTELRGIATGDVHHDGWVDVLLSSETGLYLYANQQGREFSLQQLDIDGLDAFVVLNAALVDLNNDGFLDIWFATYRQGNYVILNNRGRFSQQRMQRLPNRKQAMFTASAGFADIDRDGDLDMMLGNSFFIRPVPPEQARNVMLENKGDAFAMHEILGIPGNSLSMLLSDFNMDQQPDMIIGNDFDAPDRFFIGKGDGDFTELFADSGMIPVSTQNTMSVITADVNNDLRPDIFLAQTGNAGAADFTLDDIDDDEACRDHDLAEDIAACKRIYAIQRELIAVRESQSLNQCMGMEHAPFRRDCVARMILAMNESKRRGWKPGCETLPAGLNLYRDICEQMKSPSPQISLRRTVPQLKGSNVLLMQQANGTFENKAQDMGLSNTGWTWNAKFADLDNDGWQDIYIANGYFWSRKERSPDLFYHNMQGKRFAEQSKQAGLHGSPNTSAYTYMDIDNDGDLDIVTVSQDGAVMLYRNNAQTNHAIEFALRDHIGNSHGIGSKVIIHYGNGKHQMRELKASGGFASFDAAIAHFGLGSFDHIDAIDVLWSTGGKSIIRSALQAGYRYTVKRKKGSD